jgi:dTDP-glucose 4,6-dehydratase/UDP-glucuronate decarboxylase
MAARTSTFAANVDDIVQGMRDRLSVLRGSTLLVTGASGFLCSYFVETVVALNDAFLDPPCEVLAIDNFRTGLPERLRGLDGRNGISFVQHDVTLPLRLDRKVDWIIHGASIASPTLYRRYPLETIDVNVTGTRQLLELARHAPVRGLLYLSTSEIYGDPDPANIPTPEDYRGNVSCTGPRACYDESKRLGETLCMTYHQLFGVPTKIVRPFNVYGPGQRLDDGRIIPDLMRAVLHRQPIVLFSDGRATRAFCCVTDAIRAMWHVLLSEVQGEVFNVGNDEREISIWNLARLVRRVAGCPELTIERRVSADKDYLTDNPQRRCPDLGRLRSRFDWRPEVSLARGLARTLRWYLAEQRAAVVPA